MKSLLFALLLTASPAYAASLGPEISVGDTTFGNAALSQSIAGVASP